MRGAVAVPEGTVDSSELAGAHKDEVGQLALHRPPEQRSVRERMLRTALGVGATEPPLGRRAVAVVAATATGDGSHWRLASIDRAIRSQRNVVSVRPPLSWLPPRRGGAVLEPRETGVRAARNARSSRVVRLSLYSPPQCSQT